MFPVRRALTVVAALALAWATIGCSDSDPAQSTGPTTTTRPRYGVGADRKKPRRPKPSLTLTAVSTRPEMVTGGDVLVRVVVPPDEDPADLRLTVNGDDVTDQLRGRGRRRTALVTGLDTGTSTIRARLGEARDELDLVNHPLTGPVISGPHLPLFGCSTEKYGLGPATDDDCSAPTVVDYRYITRAGSLADLPDPTLVPADVATATIDGEPTPLIVRRERGVINRGVYTFTVVDPTPAQPTTGDVDGLAWNRRLVWRFGGGCGSPYAQGEDGASAEDVGLLARGYAVASSTFTTFQSHCNDVLAAETVMMVKEHIIETVGPVEMTIGQGASGGAVQQHLIVQNYPGLLDAAAAGAPFPDAASTSGGVTDCGLLGRYYGTPQGSRLTQEQRAVIEGMSTTATCPAWIASFLELMRPEDGCPAVPEQLRYDRDQRRGGIRCTLVDANINNLGIDMQSGFGSRALDNIGVQYGLNALKTNVIDIEQFLDLNEAMGGYDIDGNFTAARTAADPSSIVTAYAGGRVASGGGDLRVVPIIDINIYAPGDIHDRFRAFSLRDRLRLPDGQPAPNHVIWTRRPTDPPLPPTPETPFATDVMTQAVVALDEWVTAAHDDDEGGNRAEIVARNRPADVSDECLDPAGQPVRGPDVYSDGGPCDTEFPIHGDPRTAAGAPRSDDVLKCTLTPIDPADYGAGMGTGHLQRLRRIFPAGVCDWSQRGVGQVDAFGTWLSYDDGLPFDTDHLVEQDAERGVTGRDDEPSGVRRPRR